MSKARDLADSVAAGSVLADGVVSLSEVGGGTNNGVVFVNGSGTTTSGSALTFDGANLGIGNVSPSVKLDLTSGTPGETANSIRLGYGRPANPTDAIHQIQASSDNLYIKADTANTIASNIIFENDGSEAMRLTSTSLYTASGINVGIGTSNPVTKLQIGNNGTNISTAARFSTNSGGTPELLVLENAANRNTGRGTQISFYNPNGTGNSQVGAAIFSGNENSTTNGPEFLGFKTGTGGTITEHLRIDSSGTTFIRTGTSTTNTNSSKLVVDGTVSETVDSTQYLVASQADIGTAPNEIPINGYLGSAAYVDQGQFYSSANNVSFRNKIINGGFNVWQRGTTGTGNGYISADRWYSNAYTSGTISLTRKTDATGQNFTEYARFEQSVAGSINDKQALYQMIEGTYLVGKRVTVSFTARASKTLNTCMVREIFTSQTFTIGTDWQRFTFTGTCVELSGNVRLNIDFGMNNDTWYVDIAEVQVEQGSVATPFEHRPYGTELALCQRYYYRIQSENTDNGFYGSGFNYSTTNASGVVHFPVSMRIYPTALEQSGTASDYRVWHGSNVNTNCSSVPTYAAATKTTCRVIFTVSSGLTVGGGSMLRASVTGAYLAWSAEL